MSDLLRRELVADSLFPPIDNADDDGLLCEGGNFDTERLIAAYRQGIFPWGGDPVRWFSPNPRSVFWEVHISRKVKQLYRSGRFRVTADRAFGSVVEACRLSHIAAQEGPESEDGAWITQDYIDAYTELNQQGCAHSIEVWQADALVGGLYGVQVGSYFAGESMFHTVSNASKVAFFVLCRHLWDLGVVLFDSQVINYHTHSLGAALVGRSDFSKMLAYAVDLPPLAPLGLWQLSEGKEADRDPALARSSRRRFWGFNDERCQ